MSAHKHTPGQWAVSQQDGLEVSANGECIAWVVSGSIHDANLMAAAPTYHHGADAFLAYVAAAEVGDDVAAMRHFDDAKRLLSEAHANATGNGAEVQP